MIAVHVFYSGTVRIKYYGPTDSRGARLVVSGKHQIGVSVQRLTVPYSYELSDDDRLRDAVQKWADRVGYGTRSTWVVSSVGPSEWVGVCLPGCTVSARAVEA